MYCLDVLTKWIYVISLAFISLVHFKIIISKFSWNIDLIMTILWMKLFRWLLIFTLLCYAKSLQSCLTLCDPIDGSPPGSPVPGILQARTPEWVAISFSNAWKWKEKMKSLSCVQLLATLWTAAYQAPASMGFSRQEYWSGVPLPSPHIYFTSRQKQN